MRRPSGMARQRMKKQYRRTFIKEWRTYRGLSQERLADRIGKSPGLISQIETRKGPYTQETLEAIADALLCEPVDLLIRNPLDPEGIWSLWDALEPPERQQAVKVLKALKKTG
jgi:transcriptional regulator with XRE-family HTH domain